MWTAIYDIVSEYFWHIILFIIGFLIGLGISYIKDKTFIQKQKKRAKKVSCKKQQIVVYY